MKEPGRHFTEKLSSLRFRVGIDIGGTFTNGVLIEEEPGAIWIEKAPTRPRPARETEDGKA